jgi:hypothetical protein
MWKLIAIVLAITLTASTTGGGAAMVDIAAASSRRDLAESRICSRNSTGEAAAKMAWIKRIQTARCAWKKRADIRRTAMTRTALLDPANLEIDQADAHREGRPATNRN